MDHVAIMNKAWNLTYKLLTGEKTIESRWYKARHSPWGKISSGDTVYFKNDGGPVIIKSEVDKVMQFADLTDSKIKELLNKYANEDGIEEKNFPFYYEMLKDRTYCILIFLKEAFPVEPFYVDKTGFGSMAAWLCVDNINRVKI